MGSFNFGMIVLTYLGILTGALRPYPKDGTLMLIYYSGFNLYVYALAYLYVPSKISLAEIEQNGRFGPQNLELPNRLVGEEEPDILAE